MRFTFSSFLFAILSHHTSLRTLSNHHKFASCSFTLCFACVPREDTSSPERCLSMSKPVYSLSYSSMLTEDCIHTDSILASAKATAPLATFLNGQGQSEALVVFDDGELCHLQREPLSSSGWNFNGIGYKIGSMTAANRGSVWMMDEDHAIWMTNAGHWNELGGQPVGDVSISAGLICNYFISSKAILNRTCWPERVVFVRQAHQRGTAVVIDVLYNHVNADARISGNSQVRPFQPV
jgi:hypothetical protein